MSSLLNVTYYDSYSGIPGLPTAYSAPAGASVMVNGLPTASLTNVLGSANMLWTVMYYDGLARNIKTYKQHYLGGTLNAANYDAISTTYNFTNVPTTVTRQHFNTGSTTTPLITIANSYIYDHLGRKLKTWEQITPIAIGGATKILISQTVYNELSQVWDKQLHSTDSVNFLQTVAYTYNERGWLTGSNAALFSMQLLYNTGTNKQYNGNIAYQTWLEPGVSNSFTYAYDNLNRLTGGYSGDNYIENAITYDLNGNLTTLARYRANAAIDFLNYSYASGGNPTNQLQVMADYCSDTSHYGYRPGTYSSYQYDANGNMTVMPTPPDGTALANINIQYNLLNLPQAITGGRNITYTYDATGHKLRKVSVAGQNTTATDYISGIQYKNNGAAIDFIQTEEGKVVQVSPGVYDYYYYLGDNLGNTRVTFDTQSGTATPLQQDDYYPYGMEINRNVNGTKNEYLYNKKELQEELGQYDYGARFYDPVIGRWTTVDPLAEVNRAWSPFGYVKNNPIRLIDPDGMLDQDEWLPEGEQYEELMKPQMHHGSDGSNGRNPYYAGNADAANCDPCAVGQDPSSPNLTPAQMSTLPNGDKNGGSFNEVVIHAYSNSSDGEYHTPNNASQGGDGGAWGWVKDHFYEEGSYEFSVGYQFSGGLKRGLDATINLESSVISEGKISNRAMEGENNSYDNSKWTHELSASYIGGGGIKYTNDYNAGKEIKLSVGALGFLGGSVSFDTHGNVTNWFGGIDIDAHFAAIFGIEGEYKLGFAK